MDSHECGFTCLACGQFRPGPEGAHSEAACLRVQLAAANERAEKLEAQMVELRELWEIIDSGVKPKPHCEDEVGGAALAIKRILGGV